MQHNWKHNWQHNLCKCKKNVSYWKSTWDACSSHHSQTIVQTQNHGNLRPAGGAPARLLFQLGDARRTESLVPTRHRRKTWRTTVLVAYRVLIVHKNTVGGEIWSSFLSTHAFLLGNGQTYATRGVPYFRVSRIFMSRIFHPCILVPHFHVPKFHVSHFQRPHDHDVSSAVT